MWGTKSANQHVLAFKEEILRPTGYPLSCSQHILTFSGTKLPGLTPIWKFVLGLAVFSGCLSVHASHGVLGSICAGLLLQTALSSRDGLSSNYSQLFIELINILEVQEKAFPILADKPSQVYTNSTFLDNRNILESTKASRKTVYTANFL